MRVRKLKSGILSNSAAENVTLILSLSRRSINQQISWYKKHGQPSATARTIRMREI